MQNYTLLFYALGGQDLFTQGIGIGNNNRSSRMRKLFQYMGTQHHMKIIAFFEGIGFTRGCRKEEDVFLVYIFINLTRKQFQIMVEIRGGFLVGKHK
ncbi:MAG: hypothetical protein BWY27_00909 [Bacteroidetes bacterium ADurb.Bin234]|nr:MAG: hypothetical protein BWY27_00909 [Bacteroidetes bacterium ADurb.Bin234]